MTVDLDHAGVCDVVCGRCAAAADLDVRHQRTAAHAVVVIREDAVGDGKGRAAAAQLVGVGGRRDRAGERHVIAGAEGHVGVEHRQGGGGVGAECDAAERVGHVDLGVAMVDYLNAVGRLGVDEDATRRTHGAARADDRQTAGARAKNQARRGPDAAVQLQRAVAGLGQGYGARDLAGELGRATADRPGAVGVQRHATRIGEGQGSAGVEDHVAEVNGGRVCDGALDGA